jgi:hypothetical protein
VAQNAPPGKKKKRREKNLPSPETRKIIAPLFEKKNSCFHEGGIICWEFLKKFTVLFFFFTKIEQKLKNVFLSKSTIFAAFSSKNFVFCV